MGLKTIDFDWKCTVWEVSDGGRIMVADKETVVKGASTCSGEKETGCDIKVDKDEHGYTVWKCFHTYLYFD